MIFPIGTRNDNRGFTLVELLLVMTLMVVAIAVIAPSLKGFFRGRNLDGEAGRFLSLTRFGQSRAIAEGIPVELWIEPRRARYGLQAVAGYAESRTNPAVYTLDQSVQISFSQPSATLVHSNYWTQTLAQAQIGGMTKIRFQPDGFISDTSPQNIYFQGQGGSPIWLAENSTHLRYVLQNGPIPGLRH
jgi:type II secretion system protein H